MSIEQGLYDYLRSLSGVQSLVADRIYPVLAPQDAVFPRVVYSLITGDRERNLSGVFGYWISRYQIDCYALTYKESKDLSAAILGTEAAPELDGLTNTTWGSNRVKYVRCEGIQDLHETPSDGRERGIYRVTFDAIITYQE